MENNKCLMCKNHFNPLDIVKINQIGENWEVDFHCFNCNHIITMIDKPIAFKKLGSEIYNYLNIYFDVKRALNEDEIIW